MNKKVIYVDFILKKKKVSCKLVSYLYKIIAMIKFDFKKTFKKQEIPKENLKYIINFEEKYYENYK